MNRLLTRWLMAGILLVLIPLTCHAVETVSRYDLLLEKVKAGNPAADFGTLRSAYAASPHYRPFDKDRSKLKNAMFRAMAGKDYAAVVGRAEKVLSDDYVDIDAHVIAAREYARMGADKEADFHRAVARGLLDSIRDSGDGRTPETAYRVISVDEEYALISSLNLKRGKQAQERLNGHDYDRVIVTDRNGGKPYDLYFNIDIPYAWLRKSLMK